MTTKQIASGVLAAVLLALLVWSLVANVGDLRTRIMLGVGAALGAVYTVFGCLPEWIQELSGGSISDDDDPANLSPRYYVPILLAVILLATLAFFIGIWLL